jgi:hypothetical protein
MNRNRNAKIVRLSDRVGEEGRWLVEDRPAGSAEPPGTRGAAARGELRPLALQFKQPARGVAATPDRARPRALKLDFIPCRHPTQSTTTNGHPITFSQPIARAAMLAGCCGRGRPLSGAFPSRRRSTDVRCQTVSNRVKPLFQNHPPNSCKFAPFASKFPCLRISGTRISDLCSFVVKTLF